MAKSKSKSKPKSKSKSKKPAPKAKAPKKKKAAAPKKKVAAPKKKVAAPKKAAPKKAAAVAKAPPKTKKVKAPVENGAAPEELEQADLMVMDGMNVPDRGERAETIAAAQGAPNLAAARTAVLDLFRSFYPGEETDEEALQIDPNDFDIDPGPFYEELEARFGLGAEPGQDYFGGFGGKLEHTIAVIVKRWDGKLRDTKGDGEIDDGPADGGGAEPVGSDESDEA